MTTAVLLDRRIDDVRIHLQEARAAINGASLGGVKRNRRSDPAFCALYRNFDFLLDPGSLCGGYGGKPLVFCLFTFLAALWRILKILIPKECLFAGCPHKVGPAIDAKDRSVLEFKLGGRFDPG